MGVPIQLTWLREALETAVSITKKRSRALGVLVDEEKLRFWTNLVQILQRVKKLSAVERKALEEVADVFVAAKELTYQDVTYLMCLLVASSASSAWASEDVAATEE